MTRHVDLEAAVAAVLVVLRDKYRFDDATNETVAALRALPSGGEACPTCGGPPFVRPYIPGPRTVGWTNPAVCPDPFHTQPLSPGGPGDERPEVDGGIMHATHCDHGLPIDDDCVDCDNDSEPSLRIVRAKLRPAGEGGKRDE